MNKKMGRAVPLKWVEQSRIEKWTETSGPRSPGPKRFWAEESRNRHKEVSDQPGYISLRCPHMPYFVLEFSCSGSEKELRVIGIFLN